MSSVSRPVAVESAGDSTAGVRGDSSCANVPRCDGFAAAARRRACTKSISSRVNETSMRSVLASEAAVVARLRVEPPLRCAAPVRREEALELDRSPNARRAARDLGPPSPRFSAASSERVTARRGAWSFSSSSREARARPSSASARAVSNPVEGLYA